MSWKCFFKDKERKKVWQAGPPFLFWTVWKIRNVIAFSDDLLSIQKIKASFVFLLWLETKLNLVDGPLTFVSFINWVGCG